jgi:Trk K+ transport system NAD-binding subunit/Kef-type K+ transport system membrane component KefB
MPELKEIIIYLLGFVWILFGTNYFSRFFQKLNLPLITGFILMGVVVGPYVLNLIPANAIKKILFINDISLAYIALAAGAELYLKDLRSRLRSIAWNTIGQLAVTFILSTVAVYFLSSNIPFTEHLSPSTRLAVSLLMATIFVARSPSSAIAIIHEMRAKGPFTQTVMGVTVIKDVLVIILFAICVSISRNLVIDSAFDLQGIGFLLLELCLSFVFGLMLGKAIHFILSLSLNSYLKMGFILLMGYGVFFFAHWTQAYSYEAFQVELFFEPLLICIIGSFWVTNYSKFRPEFQFIIHRTGPYIYLAFFTLTGIMISIEVLAKVWLIALVLFMVRLISMIIGAYLGATFARDDPKHRAVGWMPYVTQAGVGLGLAIEVSSEFPAWGNEFATIVIAVIILNQIVGPPLFKLALSRVGESHKRADIPGFDGIQDAIIFGLEGGSLALARQLKRHGWEVTIATLRTPGDFDNDPEIPIVSIDGLDLDSLDKLNAKKSDAMIMMLSDEENYKLCELIYEFVGTRHMVVRLHDRNNLKKFHDLGCMIVDPDTALVNLLDNFVRSPVAASMLLGIEEGQSTIDLVVRDKSLHGVALRNLRLPSDVIILSVKRKGQSIISHGYTRLRKKDIVTVVGSEESLLKLQWMFGGIEMVKEPEVSDV